MRVEKWGEHLAVRLPDAVIDVLELKEGDFLRFKRTGATRVSVTKAPSAKELLSSLRKFRGRLPGDFKFDRIEAQMR